jgi:hypothetical protein
MILKVQKVLRDSSSQSLGSYATCQLGSDGLGGPCPGRGRAVKFQYPALTVFRVRRGRGFVDCTILELALGSMLGADTVYTNIAIIRDREFGGGVIFPWCTQKMYWNLCSIEAPQDGTMRLDATSTVYIILASCRLDHNDNHQRHMGSIWSHANQTLHPPSSILTLKPTAP